MTDSNYTAIAVLVDRSASMKEIAREAEGTLRTFIADQAQVEGRCTIRLSEFDDRYDTVYPSTLVASAPEYTLNPRGMTALHDSVAKLINEFGVELEAMPEDERPGKVLFVIVTDGFNNVSKELDAAGVKKIVEHQQSVYGWDFVFLAANQDAVLTGASLGIQRGSTLTFDPQLIGAAGASLSGYTTTYRGAPVGASVNFTDEDRGKSVGSSST